MLTLNTAMLNASFQSAAGVYLAYICVTLRVRLVIRWVVGRSLHCCPPQFACLSPVVHLQLPPVWCFLLPHWVLYLPLDYLVKHAYALWLLPC